LQHFTKQYNYEFEAIVLGRFSNFIADVLREGDNTSYAVGGLCTILMSDSGKHQKIKAIIPPASVIPPFLTSFKSRRFSSS